MHYNKIQIIETNKGFMDFFLLKTMRERTQGTIMLSQAGFDMQTRVWHLTHILTDSATMAGDSPILIVKDLFSNRVFERKVLIKN